MQEEIENRTVNLVISMSRLSIRAIITALRAVLGRNRGVDRRVRHHGKQRIRQLIKQGEGVTSMEISDEKIKLFERIARKYGVDFSIVKNKTEHDSKYLVFFRAKDTDALKNVLKEYLEKLRQKEKKPSVLQMIRNLNTKAQQIPKRVRVINREQIR